MPRRPEGFDLSAAARDPSFVPARADLPALLDLLGGADPVPIERALIRAGQAVVPLARARFDAATPPLRARLVRLLGRLGGDGGVGWLLARTDDPDDKSRRNAFAALGRLGPSATEAERAEIEARLLARWAGSIAIEERRVVAAALGKLGTEPARAALSSPEATTDDPELARIAAEGRLKLERDLGRGARGSIPTDGILERATRVRFHVRRGLEAVLEEELPPGWDPRIVAPTLVDVSAHGSLEDLFAARTALRFGFPCAVPTEGSIEERVAAAISAPAVVERLRRLTRGSITWRLEWASAGHRRAATFRVAKLVAARAPELRNDPTGSLWEVVVSMRPPRSAIGAARPPEGRPPTLDVEIWPKGLADPRFAYRVADVPAASNPTIAAALARAAGLRRDEVVWDPFVGSGTELVERARRAPVRALYGCDLDPRAIDAAERNLAAAAVESERTHLVVGDARACRPPEPVSLVITNPPMGRRVLDRESLAPLFDAVLANAAASLRRDGRIVWLSPLGRATATLAGKHGLEAVRHGAVDVGGFDAELQVLSRRRR